jgi:glycine hydroxymethyltransferase
MFSPSAGCETTAAFPSVSAMTRSLAARPWTSDPTEQRVRSVAESVAVADAASAVGEIERLVAENHRIHDQECLNLNPATNVMDPRAEALLSARLGSRASLGYPADKYETGLEAVEQIEIIAAELAAEVFGARYAEVRVGSGALANLYAFMATCEPGDSIIAPPARIGGHVTHHADGAAGLYRLNTVSAPVRADDYTVDVDALRELAATVRPKLITIGGSLNLYPHPVAAVREIADSVGAKVLFDAAHQCGIIAGGAWPNPLAEGAHLMTMSTYKSLGGPPSGLIVTSDAGLAERLEAIAYPGLTANFDAGKTAALAVTMLDWKVAGRAYAQAMLSTAARLAAELAELGVPVFRLPRGATSSHQFAIEAATFGGGQHAAAALRRVNLLACGIGLPIAAVDGDTNGLRIGTPEVARLGLTADDMPTLAAFIARGLDPDVRAEEIAAEVTAWRRPFSDVHFTVDRPT